MPCRSSPSSFACSDPSFTPANTTYSTKTFCFDANWYSATAAMSLGSGYAFALGTIDCLSSWLGAWRESARLTPGRSWCMLLMRDTTPTVDTVTCFGDKPKSRGSVIILTASTTAAQLFIGSPMPMNTTLRMRGVCCSAWSSCSTISPACRFPTRPMVPVAQKVQPIWQPTCEDTQTVARLLGFRPRHQSASSLSPILLETDSRSESHRMITVSTASPSCSSTLSLVVRPSADVSA
mmetsp:Transcript_9673/g.24595  ORF Transcript_9673/g.24595 Transcript_9673/m.24595 type:complete len:236 (+) Transcript_9673:43-750(+)